VKITVFTSNQPRHLSLIRDLASTAEEVFAVIEVNTIFPGKRPDFFAKSLVMQRYFARVIEAEHTLFGPVGLLPRNVRTLALKSGDLNDVPMQVLLPFLQSDAFVVFGASYIKDPLADFLVARRAINIHMGVSPYYRGSSCNFWAAFDGNLALVGATIHLLSKGLDSGDMLFHALPATGRDAFELGMRAVKSAHLSLVESLGSGRLLALQPTPQEKSAQIRYSRNADFTDEVASEYLGRVPAEQAIAAAVSGLDRSRYLHPFIY
jgi:hypothetical protein